MKMLLLLLAACVLSARAAFHPTECGKMQQLKVKTEWSQAYQDAGHREGMNDEIWEEIFDHHPEYRDQFFTDVHGDNVLSPEFRAHAARISSAFDMAINFLAFPEYLDQHTIHLGNFHKELNIPDDAFNTFMHAIMEAVHHRVGRCFDHDAWELCGALIIDSIKAHL